MQKWEYKIVMQWPTEAELNQLGDDGWELAAMDGAHSFSSVPRLKNRRSSLQSVTNSN
jgi:hypothetical protein